MAQYCAVSPLTTMVDIIIRHHMTIDLSSYAAIPTSTDDDISSPVTTSSYVALSSHDVPASYADFL